LSNSKAARRKDTADVLKGIKKEKRDLNAISRRNASGTGPVSFGTVSTNMGVSVGFNPNIQIGIGLKVGGDVMMGPIAYNSQEKTLASGVLTLTDLINTVIGISGTSWTIVNGEGGSADDLVTINGAVFSGQILYLQAKNQAITLKTTGNIHTNDNADVVLSAFNSGAGTGGEVATLIYDDKVTGGNWVVVNVGSGGAGSWVGTATSDLNMGSFDIYGVDKLKMVIDNTTAWNAADTGFDFTSTGLHAHVISGDAFEVWSNGTVKNLLAGESGLQVFVSGTKYMDIGASSSDFYSNLYIHDNYMQFTKMTAPTHSVSSYRYLFQDTADNHLKIRTNTGLIDLETSGGTGMQNPATASLDMNSKTIVDIDWLTFDSISTPSVTNATIYTDGSDILAKKVSGSGVNLTSGFANGNATGDLDMNGNDVYDIDQLSFSVSGQYMTGNSTGVNYYVPTGDSHKLYVGTTKIADLGAGSWDSTVDLYMGTNQIKSVGDPTSAQDAATKAYVDANSGGGGGSGANTTLSNLGTTSINQNLIPSSDNSKDLGTSSKQWKNLYVDGSAYIDALSMGGDIDMNSGEIDDIGELNVDGGGRLNFSGTGYIKSSGSTKITIGSTGATFNDSAFFNNSVQMNSDLNMQGGDIDMSSSGRINLVATGGSPSSFDSYVAIKVGGSTKYIAVYS
jgi:hypothetical protein